MVERQPTFVQDLCYSANDMRLMQAALVCSEGVGGTDHLEVTATSPVSGNVQVAQGHAFIANDNPEGTGDDGGMYQVYNDAPVTLAVPLNSSGVSRTDVVWAVVSDLEYAPVVSGFSLEYDDNNPTSTPPADGRTYYRLATVVVPNGAGTGGTNITAGMVNDQRSDYGLCGRAYGNGGGVIFFNSSGDWSFDANDPLSLVTVEVVGGGAGGAGAGASGAATAAVGGGGGGGGYARKTFRVEDLPSGLITITVGTGGSGGSGGGVGTAGGASSFGGLITANGGGVGTAAAASATPVAAGGAGGTAVGGDINIQGQNGGGTFAWYPAGGTVRGTIGTGGGTHLAPQTGNLMAGLSTGGANGRDYGGGGSGSLSANSAGSASGGNGANGVVIITLIA